jgi:glutamine synthetase adenylyltransferase
MAEVIYTDLNKYVILHMSTWLDPRSGVIHLVEYRNVKYLPPATGRYLETCQDGLVQPLSKKELQTYINLWHEIPQDVVDELNNATYEVVLQFQQKEGVNRHLVEIRKYRDDRHEMWRDRQLVKRMNPSELAMEQEKSVYGRVECKMDNLLSKLASFSTL